MTCPRCLYDGEHSDACPRTHMDHEAWEAGQRFARDFPTITPSDVVSPSWLLGWFVYQETHATP